MSCNLRHIFEVYSPQLRSLSGSDVPAPAWGQKPGQAKLKKAGPWCQLWVLGRPEAKAQAQAPAFDGIKFCDENVLAIFCVK